MNLSLTPDQARAQLAGLQKQKSVIDASIEMLAETGTQLHNASNENYEISNNVIAAAIENLIAVQLLQLGLQQEALAVQIGAFEKALGGSGIVVPQFVGPERKT